MAISVQKVDTPALGGPFRSSRAAAGGLWLLMILACGGLPSAQSRAPGEQPAVPLPPLAMTQIDEPSEREPHGATDMQATPDPGQMGPPLAVTQIDEGRARTGDLEAGGTFSLRFAEPLPITELLLLLFRDTPFSVVPDPDVQGSFMGELKEVTLLDVLDLVLRPLDLDYAVQDGSVRVFARRLETRLYPIDHVTTRRTSHRGLRSLDAADRSPEESGRGADAAMQLVGVDEGDLFAELASGVRTLLSERGRFNVDRKAGLLQVTDVPERLDRVSAYLDAVEARVNRQVLIEAVVVEVELRAEYAGGVDWGAIRDATADPAFHASGRNGLMVGVPHATPETLLAALAAQGRVDVLARPRVVTTNNEPAVMQVGTQDVFFVTSAEVERNGRVRQTVATPQRITEGLTLIVTPQISHEGVIGMSITPRVVGRTGETTSPTGDVVPVMSVRETDTVVRAFEGETVVVAGLMQDYSATVRGKVPVLGSLPLLGRLFRRDRTVASKTDLIILLTPRIVTPGRLSTAMLRP